MFRFKNMAAILEEFEVCSRQDLDCPGGMVDGIVMFKVILVMAQKAMKIFSGWRTP